MSIFYLLLLLSYVAIDSAAHATPTQIPVGGVARPSYGVDFNFLFKLNNMHGTWKHAWTFDISMLDRIVFKPGEIICGTEPSEICTAEKNFLASSFKSLSEFITRSADKHSWIKNPEMLATLDRSLHRKKRALLPFIGDIEHALFGIATDKELAGLKKSLSDFHELGDRTVRQITNLGDNLASLSKVTENVNQNSKKGIELLHGLLGNLTDQVNKRLKKIEAVDDQIFAQENKMELSMIKSWLVHEQILDLMLATLEIQQADMRILSGLQTVLQGYIPIEWVPPKDLIAGLETAEHGIRAIFPVARLSHDDQSIGYYYTHKLVTPVIEPTRITLVVDIPVDLGQQMLNVYSIRTFPVSLLPYNPYLRIPDANSGKFSRAVSKLNQEYDYFLITQNGDFYSYAKEHDIAVCKGEMIRECPKQFPLYAIAYESCLQSLWLDKPFDTILDMCPYRMEHFQHAAQEHLYVQVIPLSGGRWYIDAPLQDVWTVVCPQRPPETRKPCTSCIIQVDCGCGINSKWFQIPTRLSACDDVYSPFKHNYTLNPFQYQATKTPWIVNLTGSSEFASPPQISPDITLPSGENWDDVMESMDTTSYDLNRLYNKQVNETKMYRTAAEAILERIKTQDALLDEISSWPDWVVTASLILSFVNTGCIVLFCYCFFMKGVRGASLSDRLQYEKPILEIPNSTTVISIEIIILIFVVAIFVIQLVLAWPTLIQWWNTRKWMRSWQTKIRSLKACSFKYYPGNPMASVTGQVNFTWKNLSRRVPLQVDISSIATGTHLSEEFPMQDQGVVTKVQGGYHVELANGCNLVTADDRLIQFKDFYVDVEEIHKLLEIPSRYDWVSFENVKFIIREGE